MKKIIFILISMLLLFHLVSCGGGKENDHHNHEHTAVKVEARAATCTEAGNNAYYTCSDCDKVFADAACTKETTVSAQTVAALGHTWTNATCTSAKTCSACKATEGDALGHTPNAPDGDCNTALLCSVCNATVREAGVHLPERDDGNCTTEVRCDECGKVTTEAKSGHVDADGDYFCDDQNCAVSLPGAPEDNNPGFDLPIDPN